MNAFNTSNSLLVWNNKANRAHEAKKDPLTHAANDPADFNFQGL